MEKGRELGERGGSSRGSRLRYAVLAEQLAEVHGDREAVAGRLVKVDLFDEGSLRDLNLLFAGKA